MPNTVEVTTPSDREIRVTRVFDAPRQLVWDCHTKPELAKRWLLGPPGWSMPECEIDLRVGGHYRYLWRHPDGRQFGSQGQHREIQAPELLVTTERMDGAEGEAINTLRLSEADGRTTLEVTMLFPTPQIRDMALKSGMADGMGQSYDRLDAIAAGQGVG
jgi:uncharacterized protein YndB with AHSA1/START domain